MKNFIKIIKSSVYDPGFYKSIESQSTWSAFNYFIKLNIIVALVISMFLSITIIPIFVVVTSPSNMNRVIDFFPSELEIQIKDGKAISNVSGPYVIPIKSKTGDQTRSIINQKNLVTIDTTNEFNLDKFKSSDSMVYLSQDYFVFQENGGQIRIQPLKGIGNFSISKYIITSWVNDIVPFARSLIPLAVVCLIVMFFCFMFIRNLLFIVLASLIILLVEKIRKVKIDFSSIFKKSLHLITAIILLNLVLFVFHFGSIWLVNLVLFIWLYYSNTKALTK